MASYFKNTGSVYQIRRDTGHEPPRRQPVGRKISNAQLTERVKQQILKVIYDPSPGKPMRFCRKQTREETREVYILPFRLSCWFDKQKDMPVSSRSITRMNNKMPEDCAEKNPVPKVDLFSFSGSFVILPFYAFSAPSCPAHPNIFPVTV